jgi:hypothetical protein
VLKVAKSQDLVSNYLQWSSSVFAVTGGIVLAAHTDLSGHGFIFLALSSIQMLVSSLLARKLSLVIYSGALFVFVDCLGIYRWILK